MTEKEYKETEKLGRDFAAILKKLQDSGYTFSEFERGRIYEMMNQAKCRTPA